MNLIEMTLSEVNSEDRKLALQPKKETETNLAFCYTISTIRANPHEKLTANPHWHLIKQHPLLNEIYKDPPLVSYKRGRSLRDIVKAKL